MGLGQQSRSSLLSISSIAQKRQSGRAGVNKVPQTLAPPHATEQMMAADPLPPTRTFRQAAATPICERIKSFLTTPSPACLRLRNIHIQKRRAANRYSDAATPPNRKHPWSKRRPINRHQRPPVMRRRQELLTEDKVIKHQV